MISEYSLVVYKGKPAIVKDWTDGKFIISLQNNEQIKVRDKDIELLHPGPVKDFSFINGVSAEQSAVYEAWELLVDEGAPLSLKEFSDIIFNKYTPASAYAAYTLLTDRLYFSGDIKAIVPRPKDEVKGEELKRNEKLRESEERVRFLEQIKTFLKKPADKKFLSEDINPFWARFFQDIEALAYGKSPKSRTMKELGLSETPEEAHALLLKTGFWTSTVNPHPGRFGLPLTSAASFLAEMQAAQQAASQSASQSVKEERQDLCRLTAYAIDSPWSNDPDDAVSAEKTEDGKYALYVHVADPASMITFESPAEKEARDRGATIYLPEGAARMLSEDLLPVFALGFSEKSPALTFKITIDRDGNVTETEIFPSVIKVRRITYEQADKEMNCAETEDAKALRALYDLSVLIYKRRIAQGAVNIELPDVHIDVSGGKVIIEPIISYRSVSLVRECMIAAGEGAGSWAAERGIAFPYISQEVDIQNSITSGLAGSWQLRRCMRPRILSTKPGHHQGLGLDIYTQVTSPLRRYTDLLAHIQIRAFLRGENPLGVDDVSAKLGFSEAAAAAAVQAERASDNHWIMVYLSDKKDSAWDAVVLENKGNRMHIIIPSLALETQVSFQKNVLPNDNVKLILKSVNISRGEAVFIPVADGK